MPSITKSEALRRLAIEVMGWSLNGNEIVGEPRTFEYLGEDWNPFANLNHAFELQARLNPNQLVSVGIRLSPTPESDWRPDDAIACLTASADQRTRAIVRVLWGVEVEG